MELKESLNNILTQETGQNFLGDAIKILQQALNHPDISIEEKSKIALNLIEITKNSKDEAINKINNSQEESDGTSISEIDQDWQQWIAENKWLNNSDESMIQAMVNNGINVEDARQAIIVINSQPCFKAGNNFIQLLKKLESISEVKCCLRKLSPQSQVIERREKVTREEFLEKYYSTNTPVILTNMMDDWKAMSSWCPEYLKSQYGDVEVEIQSNRNSDPNYEINKENHKRIIKLAQYVDHVVTSGETNDYYMVANNSNLEREELKSLLNDINMLPELLDSSDTKGKVFFWFGPVGTITPLHHDTANLMMAQVYGRKRWRVISPDDTSFLYNYIGVFSAVDLENPDYDKYPLFKNVNVMEAILEPGEIIFIPLGWWHQVKALDISISLSFTNFVFPNQYDYKNPDIRRWN
jgi:hypothetical protein